MRREGVCILGYGETTYARESKPTVLYLAQAIKLALENSGLKRSDIGGFAISTFNPEYAPLVAEQLGFELDWVERVECGGASPLISVRRAADATQLGQIDVAVCVGGDIIPPPGVPVWSVSRYQHDNYIEPFGYGGPNSLFGMNQRLHMAKYGTTLQQLGKIAVSQRKNAEFNENALFRSPMTIDDYIKSRVICDPIRLFDCVRPVSGAAAVVVASERKARQITDHPVYILVDCEKINYKTSDMAVDRTVLGHAALAEELFADISRDKIDFVQIYDDYPIAVLMQIEDLGFCPKGKGGEFVDSHDLTFSGDFPLNTGGGELSVGQAGLGGGFIGIVEAVRQLKREAGKRQVKQATIGLVTGLGLMGYHPPISSVAAMILQRR